jgi:MFS family permease
MSGVALLVAGTCFMEFLDATIITTALPHMAVSFGTTAVALNVAVSAYVLTVAVFILPSG